MEYKHNKETGILEVWDKGKKIGKVITMGDIINGSDSGNSDGQLSTGVVE